MHLNSIIDFANSANEEIGKHKLSVILAPRNMTTNQYNIEQLNWQSIKYGTGEINAVPNDKRGVYAFVISWNNNILPPHGYILYIGIAGRNSNRSLRERYRDYLNEKKLIKRERIARMIGVWHEVLRFFFAPVSEKFSSPDLIELERQLNDAIMPCFSVGDLSAELKSKMRAFK